MSYFEKLTPEQQKLPYAKYVDFPYSDPAIPPEVAATIQVPMDPKNALRIEDVNLLLDPDYDAPDLGYCTMEDGTGYVAELIDFPGCTREMFEWWFAWHGLEDVRYRIWDPEDHFGVHQSPQHLRQRVDTSLNWCERNWGTSDFIVARSGIGTTTTRISFMSPEDFGFDPVKFKEQNVSCICCQGVRADLPYPTAPSIRFLRDTENGFSMRTYFWYDKCIINKQVIDLPKVTPFETVKFQTTHCAREYHRLACILPQVYAENVGIVDKYEDFETMPF